MRSLAQLSYAGAIAIGGFAAFRIVREVPTLSRITIGLVVAAVVLAVIPSINHFIKVDRCLDSGGRWNNEGLQCEY